jgi:tripartite-type tricarboxylate transporter receptor subunit TctC
MTVLAASVAARAAAQDYPSRPVTLVHGFGAGGNADTMARILAEAMSEGLGQRVVVEAKPGAGGTLASEIVAKSAPDGYTLVMLTAGHATTANLFKTLRYHPIDDFAMISTVGFYPYVIAVRKDHRFRTLADLIAASKQDPGSVTYTSVGVGTVPHLTGELLSAQAGIRMTHIPYKGGTAPITDVLSGQVDVLIDTQTVSMPHIFGGTARGLGVTSAVPWPGAPGIPAVAETLPGFEVRTWIALATVNGTPDTIIARLHREAVRVLTLPQVVRRLQDLGADVRGSSPEEMRTMVKSEIERWGKIMRAINIQGVQ